MENKSSITDGQMTMSHHDFDWNVFTERLFQLPPQDPFTFQMELLDEMNPNKLSQLLGLMLINGVRNKYQKEVAQLTPNEIEIVRQYYRSIGFDIEYQVKQETKDGVPINRFEILFGRLPRWYDRINVPH